MGDVIEGGGSNIGFRLRRPFQSSFGAEGLRRHFEVAVLKHAGVSAYFNVLRGRVVRETLDTNACIFSKPICVPREKLRAAEVSPGFRKLDEKLRAHGFRAALSPEIGAYAGPHLRLNVYMASYGRTP